MFPPEIDGVRDLIDNLCLEKEYNRRAQARKGVRVAYSGSLAAIVSRTVETDCCGWSATWKLSSDDAAKSR